METKLIGEVYNRSEQISLFRSVYLWMAMALLITGLAALLVSSSYQMQTMIFSQPMSLLGLVLAELFIVVFLTARINRLSFLSATLLFILYSIINGFMLSSVLLVYTAASVASTFFITAGTFGTMCVIGYFTKRDLSSWGQILTMVLIGLVIASLVNLFLGSSMLEWIISYVGVVLFCGLTIYDSQKIRQLLLDRNNGEVDDSLRKIALLGALSLYLDFINLFLFLLRILGRRE